jgi:hypothetical protein
LVWRKIYFSINKFFKSNNIIIIYFIYFFWTTRINQISFFKTIKYLFLFTLFCFTFFHVVIQIHLINNFHFFLFKIYTSNVSFFFIISLDNSDVIHNILLSFESLINKTNHIEFWLILVLFTSISHFIPLTSTT